DRRGRNPGALEQIVRQSAPSGSRHAELGLRLRRPLIDYVSGRLRNSSNSTFMLVNDPLCDRLNRTGQPQVCLAALRVVRGCVRLDSTVLSQALHIVEELPIALLINTEGPAALFLD